MPPEGGFKCPLCPLCPLCVSGLTTGTSPPVDQLAGEHQRSGGRFRYRVCVPQLPVGLTGEVVVSTNRELAVVRIWSAARLDELIGGAA